MDVQGSPSYSSDSEGECAEMDSIDGVLMTSRVPRDAKIIALLLKSLGVESVGSRVLPQLLEFMHVYVGEILHEACTYAKHQQGPTPKRKSKKKKKKDKSATAELTEGFKITLEDVRLATQARIHYSFVQPPPRELMLELSSNKNRIPLPLVPLNDKRVRLPPKEYRVKKHLWRTEMASSGSADVRTQKGFDVVDDPIGRPPLPPPLAQERRRSKEESQQPEGETMEGIQQMIVSD